MPTQSATVPRTAFGPPSTEPSTPPRTTWTPVVALSSGIAILVASEFLPASVLPDPRGRHRRQRGHGGPGRGRDGDRRRPHRTEHRGAAPPRRPPHRDARPARRRRAVEPRGRRRTQLRRAADRPPPARHRDRRVLVVRLQRRHARRPRQGPPGLVGDSRSASASRRCSASRSDRWWATPSAGGRRSGAPPCSARSAPSPSPSPCPPSRPTRRRACGCCARPCATRG